jgi:predicted lipoprotein with Yx(FWY)xxD motif
MSRSWKVTGRSSAIMILAIAAGCRKTAPAADTAVAVIATDSGAAVAVAVPVDSSVALEVATKPGTGVFLTDANGRAVYVLDDGSGTQIACTGPCATEFVAVPGTAMAAPGATGVNASLAGGTTGANGSKQATYNGKSLYYYNGDTAKGDTKGQGAKAGGATGSLVSPQGTEIHGKMAKAK